MLLASFSGHGVYIHIIHSQRNKLSAHFIDNSYSLFDYTLTIQHFKPFGTKQTSPNIPNNIQRNVSQCRTNVRAKKTLKSRPQ